MLIFLLLLQFSASQIITTSAILVAPYEEIFMKFCPGFYNSYRYAYQFNNSVRETNYTCNNFADLPGWLTVNANASTLSGIVPATEQISEIIVKYERITNKTKNQTGKLILNQTKVQSESIVSSTASSEEKTDIPVETGEMKFIINVGNTFQAAAVDIQPLQYELQVLNKTSLYTILCPPVKTEFPDLFTQKKPEEAEDEIPKEYLLMNYQHTFRIPQGSDVCLSAREEYQKALTKSMNVRELLRQLNERKAIENNKLIGLLKQKSMMRTSQEQLLEVQIRQNQQILVNLALDLKQRNEELDKLIQIKAKLMSQRDPSRTNENIKPSDVIDDEVIRRLKINQVAMFNKFSKQYENDVMKSEYDRLSKISKAKLAKIDEKIQVVKKQQNFTQDDKKILINRISDLDKSVAKKSYVLNKCLKKNIGANQLGDFTCKIPPATKTFMGIGVIMDMDGASIFVDGKKLLIGKCSERNSRRKDRGLQIQDSILYEVFEKDEKHWIVKITGILIPYGQ